ncbi:MULTISPECIES: hypothetical protein [unclassified Paenibacillus]|nr:MULTISPECIES: hypothetical protein [unclassified Paenibacillus]
MDQLENTQTALKNTLKMAKTKAVGSKQGVLQSGMMNNKELFSI